MYHALKNNMNENKPSIKSKIENKETSRHQFSKEKQTHENEVADKQPDFKNMFQSIAIEKQNFGLKAANEIIHNRSRQPPQKHDRLHRSQHPSKGHGRPH